MSPAPVSRVSLFQISASTEPWRLSGHPSWVYGATDHRMSCPSSKAALESFAVELPSARFSGFNLELFKYIPSYLLLDLEDGSRRAAWGKFCPRAASAGLSMV